MDCIIIDNSLYLPIRTKFLIKYHSLDKKEINLLQFIGCKQNEFFAIFEENDVDFEIWCDNRECDRRIRMTLTINGECLIYRTLPHELCKIEAMESFGRRLHFMSQNTERGRRMIAQTAHKYGISYEMASIICSRIEFRVEVEECISKLINVPINDITNADIIRILLIGPKVKLFVKTLTNKTIIIEIGLNNTVKHLKMIIAKREAIPPNMQLLIWSGKALRDDMQLEEYGIYGESTIHLSGTLRGGEQLSSVTDTYSTLSYSDNSDSDTTHSSDEISSPQSLNMSAFDNHQSSQLLGGERGVVCYGERSNEEFDWIPISDVFRTDPNITVNPFVIELRMDPMIAALI